MKTYSFHLDRYQAGWMFEPIRNKRDALELLLRSVKLMLVATDVAPELRVGSMTLVVAKMSRIFYHSGKKVFSIAFPFRTRTGGDHLEFYSPMHPQIDSRCTSELLALLGREELFTSFDVLDFADPISAACDLDTDIWMLFRELLLLEDGYIRYDDDLTRANGHRHPQHHIDLFYSQGTTFKAGLSCALTYEQFLDILNIETDCHYLAPVTT